MISSVLHSQPTAHVFRRKTPISISSNHFHPLFTCIQSLLPTLNQLHRLLPSNLKRGRSTFQFQSKNLPHFWPLFCPKRLPFLPCLVVREQTRFTLTNSKTSTAFINLSWPHSSRHSLKTFMCPLLLRRNPLLTIRSALTYCLGFRVQLLALLSPISPSIPISFPLIGLTQLVQYLVVCHVANLTPGKFHSRLSGATGHSQGIVSAVVIAASGTFEEAGPSLSTTPTMPSNGFSIPA
jgi:hypothetical protein